MLYVSLNKTFPFFLPSTHFIYGYERYERGNLLPPLHGLIYLKYQQEIFYMHSDRIAHTTAFVKPVVEHWLEPDIA